MQKAKVLIVEDDHFVRQVLSAMVSAAGYEVTGAGSAEEALELAPPLGPDAVTVDYDLPGINGLELAERLRRIEGLESVPILLVTSHEFPGDCESTPLSYVTGYLQKGELLLRLVPCLEFHFGR